MRVYLCRTDVRMTQLLLNRTDVGTAFKQVCRETVAQAMTGRRFLNSSTGYRLLYGALYCLVINMMSPNLVVITAIF